MKEFDHCLGKGKHDCATCQSIINGKVPGTGFRDGACKKEPNCVAVSDKCKQSAPQECSASCMKEFDYCLGKGKYDCATCQSIINNKVLIGKVPIGIRGGACDKEPNCVAVSDKCTSVQPGMVRDQRIGQ